MVMFAFEKLYMDVVAGDGTVCIVYLTWTEVLGLRQATAGYELYTPDGRREVVHARRAPALPDLDAGAWCVTLDVPGGPLEVRQASTEGAWAPAGPIDGLSWSVKTARADVEVRWLGDPARPALTGHGYADWVTLRKATRRLGLRRVDWGRAHVGGTTVVWNRIQPARGETWTRALAADEAGRNEWRQVTIVEMGAEVVVPRPGGPALHLGEARVLHEGPALDRARLPSALARGLARLATPPMDETRWVRRAWLPGVSGEGWALHERVCFGGDA